MRTTTAIELTDEMRALFGGALLAPGDDGYEEARHVHNGLIDKHPALIARCLTTADVVDAVHLGREQATEISVRGGGHNVSGKAVTEGGLMIDLAPMKGIRVDPRSKTIWAQGGVTWRELNRAAAVHGLATTGGVVSTTGIAGLTLGGGEGWLMGRFGMSVDNLVAVELVTATGEVLHASAEENEDLFWAVRGGGGNFGVAASFLYQAHPVSSVYGGIVAHPLSNWLGLFDFFREFVATMPDELTVYFVLTHAPDGSGQKLAAISVCHCGDDPARAEADLKPIREFGSPVVDLVQPMPYPVVNTLLDDAFPRGALNYWKSAFFGELSDDAMRTLVEGFEQCPSPMTAIPMPYYGGALSRVDPTATAFAHREPGLSPIIIAQWTDREDTEANIAWARETFDAFRPYMADRCYMNNLAADDGGFVRQAYGVNYDRLLELKRRYDPDNVFRLNLNIDPTA